MNAADVAVGIMTLAAAAMQLCSDVPRIVDCVVAVAAITPRAIAMPPRMPTDHNYSTMTTKKTRTHLQMIELPRTTRLLLSFCCII